LPDREVHRIGDEQGWWARGGVDALKIASTSVETDAIHCGSPDHDDRRWY